MRKGFRDLSCETWLAIIVHCVYNRDFTSARTFRRCCKQARAYVYLTSLKFVAKGDTYDYYPFKKLEWYKFAALLANLNAWHFCFDNLGDTWNRLPSYVDISGIPKLDLLRALWENQASPNHPSWLQIGDEEEEPEEEVFDILSGESIVEKAGYIDYFDGRAIKCDFSAHFVDSTDYNHRVGVKGTFERIVSELKE